MLGERLARLSSPGYRLVYLGNLKRSWFEILKWADLQAEIEVVAQGFVNQRYRVAQQVSDLGWAAFDFGF